MQISTTRFGKIELKDQEAIEFPEGILGFSHLRRFAIIDDPNDEIFLWLQSCEDAGIAFPILEPELFTTSYPARLTKHDLEAIRASAQSKLQYYIIVTIPQDPRLMSANLKAPIVIHLEGKVARQCVLQDNDLNIREPIFSTLQQRLHQSVGQPLRTSSTPGVSVSLTEIDTNISADNKAAVPPTKPTT
jgi:flagellar assembly factor FliW